MRCGRRLDNESGRRRCLQVEGEGEDEDRDGDEGEGDGARKVLT